MEMEREEESIGGRRERRDAPNWGSHCPPVEEGGKGRRARR